LVSYDHILLVVSHRPHLVALSPNIPDKIWRNCRWDATPSDEDFTPSPSKGKKPSAAKTSKGVVKSMRPQHTAAHKKITGDLEEEEVIIVHTESESEQDCPVLGNLSSTMS
jgi:hypothetical protein